jgi:eukaryotic-like serine/threonine-protein kinase
VHAIRELEDQFPGTDELSSALTPECLEGVPSGLSETPTFAAGEELARRYRVERLLARGGMGEVFVAYDRVLEQHVALKTLPATQTDNQLAVARLLREVKHALRVRHPNVCRVHDVAVHDENPRDVIYFMTMELIAGESLRKYARRQTSTLEECVSLARQSLLALDAVHGAGLLHRDVKSDNLLVTPEPEPFVTLIDFGLSRPLHADGGTSCAALSGSLGYMAPEQLEGGGLSPRTDLFSFGVVLFELLTGELPFQLEERRVKKHAWEAPAPSELRAEVPPRLDVVVKRCLSKAPAQRYGSAREVLAALAG